MRIRLAHLHAAHLKISCIKAVNFAFAGKFGDGIGLKEAKDVVENAVDEQGDIVTIDGELHPSHSIDAVRDYIHKAGFYQTTLCGCNMPNVKVRNVLTTDQIKTNGMQVFNVPNTEEGRNFMDSASRFLNRPTYSIKNRGRGSRKEHGCQASIPLPNSEWIALYIKDKNVDSIRINAESAKRNSLRIIDLESEIVNVKRINDSLKSELNNAVDQLSQTKIDLADAKRDQEIGKSRIVSMKLGGSHLTIEGATRIEING